MSFDNTESGCRAAKSLKWDQTGGSKIFYEIKKKLDVIKWFNW